MGWGPRRFNDLLALIVIGSIFAMWVWVPLEADIRGASIMIVTMVATYYWRKKGPETPPAP